MQNLIVRLWSIRICFAAVIVSSVARTMCAQDANPPPRQVILVDPTPRPPDLRRQYSDDPAAVKRRQDAIAMQNTLQAREIWLEANQILFLAQELNNAMAKYQKGDPMISNTTKAEEIEKLAKSMKEKLKTHQSDLH